MNVKAEEKGGASFFDNVKIALAAVVLIAGIAGYYYDQDISVLIRVGGVLLAIVLALVIMMQTQLGKDTWAFIQGSRIEMRKVVWPNRQETIQTTLAVIVFSILMGLFFWGLDAILGWGVSKIV